MYRQGAFSQPLRTACLLGLLTIVFTLTACGGTNALTAQQVIANAQTAIRKVTSYHFNLVVDHPSTSGLLTIMGADGDILVPDKLKANANVVLLGNVAKVQIIAIGAKQYVTDPITGKWQPVTGLFDPRTLSDPQMGIASILGHVQDPSAPADSTMNGVLCWSINGTLDDQYLAGIVNGGPAPAGSKVAITTCIGKADNLPYLIRMNGVVAAGDSAQTIRTFKLSKFGESLTITPPI